MVFKVGLDVATRQEEFDVFLVSTQFFEDIFVPGNLLFSQTV